MGIFSKLTGKSLPNITDTRKKETHKRTASNSSTDCEKISLPVKDTKHKRTISSELGEKIIMETNTNHNRKITNESSENNSYSITLNENSNNYEDLSKSDEKLITEKIVNLIYV